MKTTLSAISLVLVLAFAVASTCCGSGNHLVSIAVSPNPANINAPGSVQLTAIGTYSNGMTASLLSANWTTSSQVVSVSNSGAAECSLAGGAVVQVTVTASVSGVSGNTMLSCTPPLP